MAGTYDLWTTGQEPGSNKEKGKLDLALGSAGRRHSGSHIC